jgi:hypothetical protein
LSAVVPSSFVAVFSVDKTRFMFIARHPQQTQGGRVTSCHLIWLLSNKLGLWSCRLWYKHPSQLLTLWTKQDSCLSPGIRNRHRGEGWWVAIWFDCPSLNWDCGLVDYSTNILHSCWLFGKNEIQVYRQASATNTGGKGDTLPFDLIAQRWTGIVVFLTLVQTFFAAVDSLDKTRFRFIARHLQISL